MSDLDKVLQEIHHKVANIVLEKVSAQKKKMEVFLGEDGEYYEKDTGELESAASKEDLMLALALLKQNEIKAELKQDSTMGKLRQALKHKKQKSLPKVSEDDYDN
jgi:hypothetical protein